MHRRERQRGRELLRLLSRPPLFAPLLLCGAAGISAGLADRGLPPNDEGAVLTAAAKLLRGAVFYRDIDAYWFPGSAYLLAFAMRLFGEDLLVARALAATLYCVTLLTLYGVSLRLLDRARAALFAISLLSFKFLAWPGFSAYMYSDVSFAFGCIALALAMGHEFRGPSLRLVAAGAFVGLSLACKQNLGIYLALAGIALLAFPRALLRVERPPARTSEITTFVAGVALPVVALAGTFAARGLLGEWVRSGLLHPFTGYLPTSGVSFSVPLRWWELGSLQGMPAFAYFVGPYWSMLSRNELPGEGGYGAYWLAGEIFARCLYTSVLLALGWALARAVRSLRQERVSIRERRRIALGAIALAFLLSAFPRADFYHVISVYPVIWLLLFALAAPRREGGARDRSAEGAPWGWCGAVALLLVVSAMLGATFRSRMDHPLRLERAALQVSPLNAWVEPVVRFIDAELSSDERLFVYGNEAYLYFLAARFSPWPFSQLYPGQAGGDGGRALSQRLAREPPKLVVRGILTWPALPVLPEYAPILHRWIAQHFVLEHRVFARDPLVGGEPPPWLVRVLRPREGAFTSDNPAP